MQASGSAKSGRSTRNKLTLGTFNTLGGLMKIGRASFEVDCAYACDISRRKIDRPSLVPNKDRIRYSDERCTVDKPVSMPCSLSLKV